MNDASPAFNTPSANTGALLQPKVKSSSPNLFLSAWKVFTGAATRFSEADGMRAGAAVAFYAAFSIAPLLVVLTSVIGWLWGSEQAQNAILGPLTELIGERETRTLADMLNQTPGLWPADKHALIGSLIATGTMLIGATGVFVELRAAAQSMIDRDPIGWSWWNLVKMRLLAITIVLGCGFLMAVAMVVQTAAMAALHWVELHWPQLQMLASGAELLWSWAVVVFLFGMIIRWLPDTRLPFRYAIAGAAVAGTLFMIGRYGISMYIANTVVKSPLGAASSFAAILVWVYWSSQIFLIGAALAAELSAHDQSFKAETEPATEPANANS